MNSIPYEQILATATHISTDIDFRPVSDDEMAQALTRRDQAGPGERDIYASYINEAFLTALEDQGERIVFQFSFGAEPLPFETASRLSQRTIGQVAEMIGRHPRLRFQCFLASRHANQSLCTLARELPNLSLAGYWWHNFFPDVIAQVIRERLDMVPAEQAGRLLLGRLLRRVVVCQGRAGSQAAGTGPRWHGPAGTILDGRRSRDRSRRFCSRLLGRWWAWFRGWCEGLIMETARIPQISRCNGDESWRSRGENPFRCRAYHNGPQVVARACMRTFWR